MTLIFKVHYFLWYGALTSIFGYESVYARHYTNATPMQYGYLNMILPFLTVIVSPVVCSLADRQRSHRSFFTLSLVLTTIAICCYSLLPLIADRPANLEASRGLLWGPWIYYCLNSLINDLSMGVNTCLSDSFAVLQAEEQGTSFGRIIVWGTFGWATTALVLSVINQMTALPRLIPGLVFGASMLAIDVVIVSLWPRPSDFKLDIIPISAAQTLTGSASAAHREPSDYQPSNESARVNLGTEVDYESGGVQMRTKSPIQIAMINRARARTTRPNGMAEQSSSEHSLQTINSDSENHSAPTTPTTDGGRSSPYNIQPAQAQLKGPGRNLPSSGVSNGQRTMPLTGNSGGESRRDNLTTRLKVRKATSFRVQLLLLLLIMRRRKALIRYLVLFILSGFFMSMHWNYFFLYLERIYRNKFELISALSMVGQSVLGELPFFILSRKVIDFCGRSHTLSISLISIGLRFLLYGYLLPNVSMYCIVLADCFQGPNYGLFYVVMTEVGLEFSFCDEETIERLASRGELDRNNKIQVDSLRLSLRSTVQSVAYACYEGLGVGLGSLAGGWLVASYGFRTLWLSMAFCAISVGGINLLIEFGCREHDPEEEDSDQREFMHASRMGTLRVVASPAPLPPLPARESNAQPQQSASQPQSKLRPPPAATTKALVMARKSAGSRVGPAAAISNKREAST